MRRLLASGLLLASHLRLLGRGVRAADPGALVIPWTTDPENEDLPRTYGPDGPWQAALFQVGDADSGAKVAAWPSGTSYVQVLTSDAGGRYNPDDSGVAVQTPYDLIGLPDLWGSALFQNISARTEGYYDMVSLIVRNQESKERVNASVQAVREWTVNVNPTLNYTPPVDILGLGYNTYSPDDSTGTEYSIISQLKAAGRIASNTFSMHIGSAALGQPGSLVLGGYDASRIVGPVGTFRGYGDVPGQPVPLLFLTDVTIGVETGGSPFGGGDSNSTAYIPGSVYKGIADYPDAENAARQFGPPTPDAAIVVPNPSSPYIYLPRSACMAAARHLPVTWDDRLLLFLWNVSDPRYARIVRSPAYMGFSLAATAPLDDRQTGGAKTTNLTIKVPFALLNLTLTAPLVGDAEQVPYFPCKPWDVRDEGGGGRFWQLGRAFLQAAFLAVDSDREIVYVAQAPGPGMGEGEVRSVSQDGYASRFNGSEPGEFGRSWSGVWTVIPGGDGEEDGQGDSRNGSGNAGDAGSGTGTEVGTGHGSGDDSSQGDSSRLSKGAIAGIAVGCVAAIAISVTLCLLCCSRQRKRQSMATSQVDEGPAQDEAQYAHKGPSNSGMYEWYAPVQPQELCIDSDGRQHELEAPHTPLGSALGGSMVYELPSPPMPSSQSPSSYVQSSRFSSPHISSPQSPLPASNFASYGYSSR